MSARRNDRVLQSVSALVLCAGCANILGIDGDYVAEDSLVLSEAGAATDGGSVSSGAGGSSSGAGGSGAAGAGASAGGAAGGSPGGASGSGGLGAGGGMPPDAAGGQGGADPMPCPDGCPDGEKCCDGVCVPPSPNFGCTLDSCDRCGSIPNNAVGKCNGDACGFECIPGYMQDGNQCVPDSSAGGAGGGIPTCDPATCPPCVTAVYAPCCQDNGACGCAFPFAPCFPR